MTTIIIKANHDQKAGVRDFKIIYLFFKKINILGMISLNNMTN